MAQRGKIIVIAAPSGTGKTTIIRSVFVRMPELIYSVSATTRKKRRGEKEGVDYFFISEAEFMDKIQANEFAEWEQFYGYYYGTPRKYIEETINTGATIILEIDVKGALQIKSVYPEAKLIFIAPPDLATLKDRLVKRQTETPEDLAKRIERVEMELAQQSKFEFTIVNDRLEDAVNELENLIRKLIKE